MAWAFICRWIRNQSNVNVELTLKDEEHVIAFKNAICPTAKVRERTVRLNDKDCIAYRVAISSKKIANDLIKQGCVQAKSLILEWPKYVPDSLIHHFIRGYFDGDGTVGIYKLKNGNTSYSFRIMGTKPFLNSLMNMLYLKLGFSKVKLLARNNCKALTYTKGGKTSFIKFKDFIYHDATIFLKRKKEIFDSISQ